MKMKKLLSTLMLGAMFLSVTPIADAGKYDKMGPTSILPTARSDAEHKMASAKKDDKKEGAEKTDNEKIKANYQSVIKTVVDDDFGNIGSLYGPINSSSFSIESVVRDRDGMTLSTISELDAIVGGYKATHYHRFGRGIQGVIQHAKEVDRSNAEVEDAFNAFDSAVGKFTTIGFDIIKKFNPAPVVLSFYDSSTLSDAKYTGKDGNIFINAINKTESLRAIVKFFGDPSIRFGGYGVSNAFALASILVIWLFAINILMKVFGSDSGSGIKKALVRIILAAGAIPLLAYAITNTVNFIDDVSKKQSTTYNSSILSNNLDIGAWAQSGFAIPSGMTLTYLNGNFKLTPEQVKQINLNSYAYQGFTDEDGIVKKMKNAIDNNNETDISFQKESNREIGGLIKLAESLGEGKELKDFDPNIPYLRDTNLVGSGKGDDEYEFRSPVNGVHRGLNPISTYNLLASSFTPQGFTVESNINTIKIPAVAVAITSQPKTDTAPVLLRVVTGIMMIFAAVKALAKILTAGFGSLFRGGPSAAVGSEGGAGELFGGFVAIVGGILGLSVIMVITNGMIDMVWNLINELINIDGLTGELGFADKFTSIPIIGSLIKSVMSTIITAIFTVIGIIFLPQIVKIPLDAFGEYMSGLPSVFKEKFKRNVAVFTGSRMSGGGPSFSDAMKNAHEAEKEKDRKGVGYKAGLKTLAAGTAGYVGGKLLGNKDKSMNEDEKDEKSMNEENEENKNSQTENNEETTEQNNENHETMDDNSDGNSQEPDNDQHESVNGDGQQPTDNNGGSMNPTDNKQTASKQGDSGKEKSGSTKAGNKTSNNKSDSTQKPTDTKDKSVSETKDESDNKFDNVKLDDTNQLTDKDKQSMESAVISTNTTDKQSDTKGSPKSTDKGSTSGTQKPTTSKGESSVSGTQKPTTSKGESSVSGTQTPSSKGESSISGTQTPSSKGESSISGTQTPSSKGESSISGTQTPSSKDESSVSGTQTLSNKGESSASGSQPPSSNSASTVSDSQTPSSKDESLVSGTQTPSNNGASTVSGTQTPSSKGASTISGSTPISSAQQQAPVQATNNANVSSPQSVASPNNTNMNNTQPVQAINNANVSDPQSVASPNVSTNTSATNNTTQPVVNRSNVAQSTGGAQSASGSQTSSPSPIATTPPQQPTFRQKLGQHLVKASGGHDGGSVKQVLKHTAASSVGLGGLTTKKMTELHEIHNKVTNVTKHNTEIGHTDPHKKIVVKKVNTVNEVNNLIQQRKAIKKAKRQQQISNAANVVKRKVLNKK